MISFFQPVGQADPLRASADARNPGSPEPEDIPVTPLAEVEAALMLRGRGGLFVDFDETLLLDNSTAAYLRSLRPRMLAWFILKLITLSRVWLLFPGDRRKHVYHDWLRVVIPTILMPWSLPLWRWHHAPRIARESANTPLINLLKQPANRPTAVVSLGFGAVVRPLHDRLLPGVPLVCGTFLGGFRLRSTGKRKHLEQAFGKGAVAGSTVITNSENDRDLLDACAVPVVAAWSDARVAAPFADLYIPFRYMERAKRPGQRYLLNGVIKYDIVAIVLAYAWDMPQPVLAALGLALIHLAVFAVYEAGYVDNDVSGSKWEKRPTLHSGYEDHARRFSVVGAFAVAIAVSVLGAVLLNIAEVQGSQPLIALAKVVVVDVALIGGLFGAIFLFFRIFNRSAPDSRSVLYPLLQTLRLGIYGVLASATPSGAALIAAICLGRWYPYMIYRVANVRPEGPTFLLVLVTFLLIMAFITPIAPASVLTIQFVVILAWLTFRARRAILAYVKAYRLVDGRGRHN
jgi:hypothetical protein